MKNLYKTLFPYLKNKYIAATLVFIVWILFFDQNDLISQIKLIKKKNKLLEDKAYYQKQIEITQKEYEELTGDEEKLERIAREKYFMKKENEDVFVIVSSENQEP
ncbi:MAG: septum formation initiator family protein [Bacteroidetes bacterium]|nr:MAG: septum formation initiator family protein [Bacteroidota bacterium]